jgi:hypothetical protein
MDKLIQQFEDKVTTSYHLAREFCESGAATAITEESGDMEPGEGSVSAVDVAGDTPASATSKQGKKNRKEKERKARKKARERQAGYSERELSSDPARLESRELATSDNLQCRDKPEPSTATSTPADLDRAQFSDHSRSTPFTTLQIQETAISPASVEMAKSQQTPEYLQHIPPTSPANTEDSQISQYEITASQQEASQIRSKSMEATQEAANECASANIHDVTAGGILTSSQQETTQLQQAVTEVSDDSDATPVTPFAKQSIHTSPAQGLTSDQADITNLHSPSTSQPQPHEEGPVVVHSHSVIQEQAEAEQPVPTPERATTQPQVSEEGPVVVHAHPVIPEQSGPSAANTAEEASAGPANPSPAGPPEQRLIEFDTYEFPCQNHDCRKLTNPFDGATVICPRCGPYSRVRYCSKRCLFDDFLMHWGNECGQCTLTQKADPLTIERRQIAIQPFLPSLTHHDRPERHRQMIHHSLDTNGDYFIFSDYTDQLERGFPMPVPALQTATGRLLVSVSFPNTSANTADNYHSRFLFIRLLRIVFLVGTTRADLAYTLFQMIAGRLIETQQWNDNVRDNLVWEFVHEFGWSGSSPWTELLQGPQVQWAGLPGRIGEVETQHAAFLRGRAWLGVEWTNNV